MLLIDCDADDRLLSLATLTRRLRFANKRPLWLAQERSRSGRGWHLWLAVTPVCTPMETVALQAVCGSDLAREANNVLRVNQLPHVSRYWRTRWNVFYQGFSVSKEK